MKVSGFSKGQAKKLSDSELTAEVVKDEFCKRSPQGIRRLVYGITITNLQVQAGRTDMANAKNNDPRTFTATGTISYKTLKETSDHLRKMVKPAEFSVVFKEALDEMGAPDAAVISYSEVV